MPIRITDIHKETNVSEFIENFHLCFVNLIVKRNKMKLKLSFYYDNHFKFPNRNTGFIFKVYQYKCKHEFT